MGNTKRICATELDPVQVLSPFGPRGEEVHNRARSIPREERHWHTEGSIGARRKSARLQIRERAPHGKAKQADACKRRTRRPAERRRQPVLLSPHISLSVPVEGAPDRYPPVAVVIMHASRHAKAELAEPRQHPQKSPTREAVITVRERAENREAAPEAHEDSERITNAPASSTARAPEECAFEGIEPAKTPTGDSPGREKSTPAEPGMHAPARRRTQEVTTQLPLQRELAGQRLWAFRNKNSDPPPPA
ncbi:hypothetical protein MRX96_029250 [Rhipicephalus microplus]